MNNFEILLLALVLDAIIGEPRFLWSRIPHPAVLMGRGVDWIDQRLNTGGMLFVKGVMGLGLLCLLAAGIGILIGLLPDQGVVECIVAAILLAHRSLVDHVRAVARALGQGIEEARYSVSLIVGRDTAELDESGVSRAAIESAAENFSDGVVAPAFWFLLFNLPGLFVYKMVNTADSMIGHMDERYALFGRAAARLDDWMNWIPARITGGLLCIVGMKRGAWELIREEAQFHRSPNAGWPEAAMAASLGVALAGPRSYAGQTTMDMFINGSGRRAIDAKDIRRAIWLLWKGWAALILILALLAGIVAIA